MASDGMLPGGKGAIDRADSSGSRKVLGIFADIVQAWSGLSALWRWAIKGFLSSGLFAAVAVGVWHARNEKVTARGWYGFVLVALLTLAALCVWIGYRFGWRRARRTHAQDLDHHSAAAATAADEAHHKYENVLQKLVLIERLADHWHEALEDPKGAKSVLHHMRDRIFAVITSAFPPEHDIRIAFFHRHVDGTQTYLRTFAGWYHGYGKSIKDRRFHLDKERINDTLESTAFAKPDEIHYVGDIGKEPKAKCLEQSESAKTVMCIACTGLGSGEMAGPVGVLRVSSKQEDAFTDSDRIAIKLAAAALGAAQDYLSRPRTGS